jgi:hypothetical protein
MRCPSGKVVVDEAAGVVDVPTVIIDSVGVVPNVVGPRVSINVELGFEVGILGEV